MRARDLAAPPTLTDGVIVLDGFTLDDLPAHLAGEDEEHARRFGWHPARSTPETVRAAILRWQENWRTGGSTRAFAMRDARTGGLVGGCEVRLRELGLAHMSYWTFPAHRRRGLATWAVRLACAYAFTELAVERMELRIEADNVASRRVARRAGFREDGVVTEDRGEAADAAPQREMVRYVRWSSAEAEPKLEQHRFGSV
jgi:RimJ/RimL family protein N-acetyltransferase